MKKIYAQFVKEFQSTPPVKAATFLLLPYFAIRTISIHAAREGGDQKLRLWWIHMLVFQSTPPVKAATLCNSSYSIRVGFQSTPPVKAATIRKADAFK